MNSGDPFDPNEPDPLRARGFGKRPAMWRAKVAGLVTIAVLSLAWVLWS